MSEHRFDSHLIAAGIMALGGLLLISAIDHIENPGNQLVALIGGFVAVLGYLLWRYGGN